jgi:hypothetical protein
MNNKELNNYVIEQRAEIWVRTTVQARTAADAMELGKQKINSGDYYENMESFDLQDDYWIGGTDPNVAVSLNNDGSITELRIRD